MSKIVELKNFRIDAFRSLLEQNLMVGNQLMLEFSKDMIKSCSFSASSSMMKLWTAPLVNFIQKQKESPNKEIMDLDDLDKMISDEEQNFDFDKFNFYVLKGDLFKRFLSVFYGKSADIEIHVEENQASKIVVKGQTVNESFIEASFILTTEEMISNKVEDYDKAIEGLTPTKEGMSEFMLTEKSIQEIKKLVKDLHKSIPENTGYLLFEIDADNQVITISDKVFKLKYDISLEEGSEKLSKIEENISFKILKSDFVIVGNHTFFFHVSNNDDTPVIMRTNYSKSLIGCLISKVSESMEEENQDIVDSTIDAVDIDEYFN